MGLPEPHEDLTTEELFRRFAPFVARFLYRLGVRADGLDDAVQDVFLVVHRRGGYKSGPAKPTSYLATIATNAASAYRRKRQTERVRSSDTEVEELVSTNKTPVQVLEATERLLSLQAALDRLEPDFRSTLILAEIEGESCASIAASMGVATGTVYWRLHEARKRFQRALRAEEAGVAARIITSEARETTGSEPRERSALFAFAVAPLWLLSGSRRLLRAGATAPPVHYDVLAGLSRHRQLADAAALPSWAPPAIVASASGSSVSIGVLGMSGAGIAGTVALVASVFSHAKPPAVAADRARGQTATSAASPAVTVHGDDTRTPTAVPVPLEDLPRVAPAASETAAAEPSARVGERPAPRAASNDTPPASAAAVNVGERLAPSAIAEENPASSNAHVEAREIARAERLLSSNPAGALAVVRDARARFTPSFLPEERDYVEVMALRALGRTSDAKTAAARFLRAYPGSAFDERVRGVIE